MKSRLLLFLLSCLVHSSIAQQPGIDSLIEEQLKQLHIPGLGAAKIEQGAISWTRYFGSQDIYLKWRKLIDLLYKS
ncbi:hypothetical protein [Dyadobacter sp. MSC1_007]|jgi:hypothetical protein|uniref:hypothetical protein n=1 Tax=Dyadobacter sp. MSC1_007 TaxID=2909264 RepID=UPI00202E6EC9|nr:hypothetical protein [Dyadobacter sp. MSC1_007]